jgi:hypothetical protein
MDEDYWGDPHVFRPDRFINDNCDFVPDKRVCQFGFGVYLIFHPYFICGFSKIMILDCRKTLLHWSHFGQLCRSNLHRDSPPELYLWCYSWSRPSHNGARSRSQSESPRVFCYSYRESLGLNYHQPLYEFKKMGLLHHIMIHDHQTKETHS